MNQLIAVFIQPAVAIALISSLLVTQGCSIPVKSNSVSPETQENPDHQSMSEYSVKTDTHGNHAPVKNETSRSITPQAKLTVSSEIIPNQSVRLVIEIKDASGKPLTDFDTFQERLMHIIVVSDDLSFFSHIHANHKGNGKFEADVVVPSAGHYKLFSSYKPTGQHEQVSVLNFSVSGEAKPTDSVQTIKANKIVGNTQINLSLEPATLQSGKEVMLKFKLLDVSTNKIVTDLQPYLGETGHLVIIKQSDSLTASDYIHAHAMQNSPTGQVNFMTQFSQRGKYKIWLEMNRNEQILTADFWVNVLE